MNWELLHVFVVLWLLNDAVSNAVYVVSRGGGGIINE
jgi:hypothetical protein